MNVAEIVSGSAFKDTLTGDIYHIIDSQLEKKVSGWKGQIKYTTIKENGEMKNSRQSIETFQTKNVIFNKIDQNELAERYEQIIEQSHKIILNLNKKTK